MHAWELTRYLIQNQIIIDKEPRRHRMLELIGYLTLLGVTIPQNHDTQFLTSPSIDRI